MAKIRAAKGKTKPKKVGATLFVEKGESPSKPKKTKILQRKRIDNGQFDGNKRLAGYEKKTPSINVKLSGYKQTKEIVIGTIGKLKTLQKMIPELKIRVTRGKSVVNNIISSAKITSDVFKKYIGRDKIQTQEFFAVMYLAQNNKVLGVYMHSMGAINATVTDIRLILGGALKMGAMGIIICHNHPSGNLRPSDADKNLTKQIIKAADIYSINVLDHIIITKDDFYSFAENGLM